MFVVPVCGTHAWFLLANGENLGLHCGITSTEVKENRPFFKRQCFEATYLYHLQCVRRQAIGIFYWNSLQLIFKGESLSIPELTH